MAIFIDKFRQLRRRGPSTKSGQKGVSLIITFFIMIIILAVVLSISVLLYSEVKVIRNMGDSMTSLYAAESGIEKVLYYDRQVVPTGAVRGLCSIFDAANNPNYCLADTSPSNSNSDHSIYCNETQISGDDCDPTTCTSCSISFNTTFDSRTYSVTAAISPSYYLDITSGGTFGGAERKIEINTPLH